ncbi:MAG: polysaccharide deacetylase family protein [Alphaproteobacteria bacterium]|nr:polysaccharide deacetylase family protein [Alphaproteobacteria bacterium]
MSFHTIDRKRVRALRCGLWSVFVLSSLLVILVLLDRGADGGWVALALTGTLAGLAIGHRWMKDEGGVPVLTYHSISDDGGWLPWRSNVVTPETFDRHMRMLRERGLGVIRTRDLIEARQSGKTLPPRPVVVTLDDGALDNWVAALPILRRWGVPATLFVSLDFIENGNAVRPSLDDVEAGTVSRDALNWRGYLNWAEIEMIRREGLVDIQPHGIDHGRVDTGPREVGELTPANWRKLAWVQWRAIEGPKADWHLWEAPPVAPIGTKLRENAPALAAPAWRDEGGLEATEAFEARLREHLERPARVLGQSDVFCWPENATCDTARRIACEVGYRATTAGDGANRPGEDPRVISRVGVGDRVIGFRWPAIEALALWAAIRVFQGNLYWYFPLLALGLLRKAMRFTPSRLVRR